MPFFSFLNQKHPYKHKYTRADADFGAFKVSLAIVCALVTLLFAILAESVSFRNTQVLFFTYSVSLMIIVILCFVKRDFIYKFFDTYIKDERAVLVERFHEKKTLDSVTANGVRHIIDLPPGNSIKDTFLSCIKPCVIIPNKIYRCVLFDNALISLVVRDCFCGSKRFNLGYMVKEHLANDTNLLCVKCNTNVNNENIDLRAFVKLKDNSKSINVFVDVVYQTSKFEFDHSYLISVLMNYFSKPIRLRRKWGFCNPFHDVGRNRDHFRCFVGFNDDNFNKITRENLSLRDSETVVYRICFAIGRKFKLAIYASIAHSYNQFIGLHNDLKLNYAELSFVDFSASGQQQAVCTTSIDLDTLVGIDKSVCYCRNLGIGKCAVCMCQAEYTNAQLLSVTPKALIKANIVHCPDKYYHLIGVFTKAFGHFVNTCSTLQTTGYSVLMADSLKYFVSAEQAFFRPFIYLNHGTNEAVTDTLTDINEEYVHLNFTIVFDFDEVIFDCIFVNGFEKSGSVSFLQDHMQWVFTDHAIKFEFQKCTPEMLEPKSSLALSMFSRANVYQNNIASLADGKFLTLPVDNALHKFVVPIKRTITTPDTKPNFFKYRGLVIEDIDFVKFSEMDDDADSDDEDLVLSRPTINVSKPALPIQDSDNE